MSTYLSRKNRADVATLSTVLEEWGLPRGECSNASYGRLAARGLIEIRQRKVRWQVRLTKHGKSVLANHIHDLDMPEDDGGLPL